MPGTLLRPDYTKSFNLPNNQQLTGSEVKLPKFIQPVVVEPEFETKLFETKQKMPLKKPWEGL